ncbi:porin [Vibrio kyushuensis]|uniref:porin n=1 Tax=Vibrio kyushuensis TaxID=2910249 RepID=UPI003D104693
MNKTLIALAVSAAAVATGVNANTVQSDNVEGSSVYSSNGQSLEIGGRAEARLSMKDGNAADASRARLNFLGKTEITDGLYGKGFWETELTTDGTETRYVYAAIGGQYGEVAYGKTDGALGVITDFTDIMSYHGATGLYKLDVADRDSHMIAYKGSFADLDLKASYRFADRVNTDEDGTINKEGDFYSNDSTDGYSLSAVYTIADTGVTIGGGYADQSGERKVDGETIFADSTQFVLGASYNTDSYYFGAAFVDGQDKELSTGEKIDITGYEFAAAYKLNNMAFTTTYSFQEDKIDGDKLDLADNIAIDATYYFANNVRTYISYNFNLLDSDKVGKAAAEDELALGLRYDF